MAKRSFTISNGINGNVYDILNEWASRTRDEIIKDTGKFVSLHDLTMKLSFEFVPKEFVTPTDTLQIRVEMECD